MLFASNYKPLDQSIPYLYNQLHPTYIIVECGTGSDTNGEEFLFTLFKINFKIDDCLLP